MSLTANTTYNFENLVPGECRIGDQRRFGSLRCFLVDHHGLEWHYQQLESINRGYPIR